MRLKKTDSKSISSSNSKQSIKSDPEKRMPQSFRDQLRHSTNQRASHIPIVKSILRSAISVHICNICTNAINDDEKCAIDTKCNHIFCFQCLSQFCIYKINVNEEVYCPEDGCQEKLGLTSGILHRLPQQVQERFKKQCLWRQTVDNPNIKLCPAPDCSDGIVDMLLESPKCRECLKQFCKECMMPTHQGPCDSNFQMTFCQWKRCPNCKMFIQKDEGCNHMTCQCSHQFCFVCLSDWESSHYECIEGLDRRLCFDDQQSMNSATALIFLVLFIILFPFLLTITLIVCIAIFVLCIPLGVIAGPIALCQQMNSELIIICFICIVPFAIVVGAICVPIMVLITVIHPKVKRLILQYCNTIDFVVSQSCKETN